jgi:hypothetical protein
MTKSWAPSSTGEKRRRGALRPGGPGLLTIPIHASVSFGASGIGSTHALPKGDRSRSLHRHFSQFGVFFAFRCVLNGVGLRNASSARPRLTRSGTFVQIQMDKSPHRNPRRSGRF